MCKINPHQCKEVQQKYWDEARNKKNSCPAKHSLNSLSNLTVRSQNVRKPRIKVQSGKILNILNLTDYVDLVNGHLGGKQNELHPRYFQMNVKMYIDLKISFVSRKIWWAMTKRKHHSSQYFCTILYIPVPSR